MKRLSHTACFFMALSLVCWLSGCGSSQPTIQSGATGLQSAIELSETSNPANTVVVDDHLSEEHTVADLVRRTSGVSVRGAGSDVRVLVRGVNSLVGDIQPLLVVDGLVMGNDYRYVADLNANTIQSIRVVKDADPALYGSRGASGVILIRNTRK